jgi:hypothetical protein
MDRMAVNNQEYRLGFVLYQPFQKFDESVSIHSAFDGHIQTFIPLLGNTQQALALRRDSARLLRAVPAMPLKLRTFNVVSI